jgi:perosamine synthetase
MPTVVFDLDTGVTREKLQAAFLAENIDARVFFWPLSSLPIFFPLKSNPNARSIPGRAMNLPSYHEINREEQGRVIDLIEKSLR